VEWPNSGADTSLSEVVSNAVCESPPLLGVDRVHEEKRWLVHHEDVRVFVHDSQHHFDGDQPGFLLCRNANREAVPRLHPTRQPRRPTVETDTLTPREPLDHPSGDTETGDEELLD
jgi:hypothetical protein